MKQKQNAFLRLLLPGFVFQSVVIAGGYGTGRELVEFFLSSGPKGGLLGIIFVTTPIWSAVCAVTFELARTGRTYDYRTFFQRLLGRGWFLFEVAYMVLMVLILAVIAAAAGSILQESFGLAYWLGVILMMGAVGVLLFWGTGIIERFMAGWSFLLYGVYITLFAWGFAKFGPEIQSALAAPTPTDGWAMGGVRYAAYNLALIPVILFVARHFESRRDAVTAGLLAGPIAILPGLFFYIITVGFYPDILQDSVPATRILTGIGAPWFTLLFQITLFGTLIETGTGLIHGFNERLAEHLGERGGGLTPRQRAGVALALLGIGAGVAQFGLIDLIGRGYGYMTWVFMAVFVLPVLTLGVWRMLNGWPGDQPEA